MADVLSRALGAPSDSRELPMQNAYGANFTGQVMKWDTGEVLVDLSARLSRIDDASLVVTYKPLAPPERNEEIGAPF